MSGMTCRKGHPRTSASTGFSRVGKRFCKICESAWKKQKRKQPGMRAVLSARAMRWARKNRNRVNRAARKITRDKYEWANALKAASGCVLCGEKHPACLDFHHRVAHEKKATVSLVICHWSRKKLEDEIAKCDVLCANCHRKHHWLDRELEGVSF